MANKWVYMFSEGDMTMRNLLGGKGANLAEMTSIGLPVPQGFTITTEACTQYYEDGRKINDEIMAQAMEGVKKMEEINGKKFGDLENPLLVSVRSGARASMPGMMDTILNLGLNDEVVAAMIKGNPDPAFERFVYDSYRRFIQMFSDVVMEVGKKYFEQLIDKMKEERGVKFDIDLTAADLKELAEQFKAEYKNQLGTDFPSDPVEQLKLAIEAVFRSWDNPRANVYRRDNDIPYSWGTAVNVMPMVFGNLNNESGTGVAFTRDPATGENKLMGEFLINAQGEDVVAGVRTPMPIAQMEQEFPEAYAEFLKVCETLENHYHDMQDMEFTVENKKLYMLQCRNGKRTAPAALKIACDLVDEGHKTEEEAVAKVTKEQEKALSNKINDDDDLYLIGVSSDLKVTGYTEDHWYDDSDFLVSGTVSATYAKVTKKTVDQSTFGSLWNDIKALFGNGEATNKKLEDAARKAVEADGGIFVSANWDDWKFGKATIRYVAGVSVKTDEKTTAAEAQNAVQDAALAQAKANGATGVYNVKTTATDTIAHTSYSYEINYLEKTGDTTTNTAVRTETYANAEVLTGQIIQNLNYIQGNIKLTQKDETYRKFVDDAKALTEKYQKLLQDAQDAQKDVVAAQGKVEELKKEIEALKSNRTSNLGALKELEGKLTVAEQNKKDAEDTLKEILDSLDEAGGELDKAIERLTPAPTPAAPAGGSNEGTGDSGAGSNAGNADAGNADAGATVITPVVFANAPVAQATVVTQNQAAAQGVTQIADEAAPLAANVEEDTQKTAEEAPKAEEAVNIADEAVPLADVAVESEHAKMSWWWWLIILILGATGYEMYKKHNEKKLKAQAENAGDIEE